MSVGGLLLLVGLACLAVAFLLGGAEERIFVIAQASAGVAEHYLIRVGDIPEAILVDLAVLAVALPIALRSNKAWPLLAASLCVATLMSEAAQLLVNASAEAYSVLQGCWDLLADLVVVVGALSVWRARRIERALALVVRDGRENAQG